MTPVDVLLRAPRDFLRDELRPHLSGYSAYQNRIAVNLLALLEREERHGAALHALDAQRLEQLGKQVHDTPQAVSVLIGAGTAARLGPDIPTRAMGAHKVPGRQEEVEVFSLV